MKNVNSAMTKNLAAACAVAALLAGGAGVGIAQAADVTWNTTTGDWSAASNWNPQQVPGGGDKAILDNGGTSNLAADAGTIGELFMGHVGDASVLNVNAGGSLSVDKDSWRKTNGIAQINVSGGTLTFTNANSHAFALGSAEHFGLNLSAGTVNFNGTTRLSWADGAQSDITVSGGTMNITAPLVFVQSSAGTAAFTQTGGTVAPTTYLYNQNNSSYTISGGTLGGSGSMGRILLGNNGDNADTSALNVEGSDATISLHDMTTRGSSVGISFLFDAAGVSPIQFSSYLDLRSGGVLTVDSGDFDFAGAPDEITLIDASSLLGAFTATNVDSAFADHGYHLAYRDGVILTNALDLAWNTTTGDWGDAANWDPQQVPTGNDTVTLANGGTTNLAIDAGSISKLTMGHVGGGASTLNVNTGGSLTVGGASWNQNNADAAINVSGGTLTFAGGSAASFAQGDGQHFAMNVTAGTVNFNDSVTMTDNATAAGDMSISGGTVNFNGSFTPSSAGQATVTQTGGTVNLNHVGLWLTQGGSVYAISGGAIVGTGDPDTGEGRLTMGQLNQSGTGGTFRVIGDNATIQFSDVLPYTPDSTFDFVFGEDGVSPIQVAGNLYLGYGGTLDVEAGDFDFANAPDTLALFTYGGIWQEFDPANVHIDPMFAAHDYHLAYGANALTLTVPEPTTLALMGVGGLVLLSRRRRSRTEN